MSQFNYYSPTLSERISGSIWLYLGHNFRYFQSSHRENSYTQILFNFKSTRETESRDLFSSILVFRIPNGKSRICIPAIKAGRYAGPRIWIEWGLSNSSDWPKSRYYLGLDFRIHFSYNIYREIESNFYHWNLKDVQVGVTVGDSPKIFF